MSVGASWQQFLSDVYRIIPVFLNNFGGLLTDLTPGVASSVIVYEYPFNERIRAHLRLEYLFDRFFFFAVEGDARQHQIALATLFDILEASERTDVKGAVLQDVEKQKLALIGLRDHPGVAQDALEAMLQNMEKISTTLCGQGKTGQSLREHEWLVSLRGRLAVPGSATHIDMPSYRAWQHKPAPARCADLRHWIAPLAPLYEGLSIVLRLLRESGRRADMVAEQGAYQQMLGGKLFQLLRVWVDPAAGAFPEMSANKYMISIRFSAQDGELKPQQVGHDVSFQMALCNA